MDDAQPVLPTREPTQYCTTCGRWQVVLPDGRGFPPDIAKRRLAKRCKADGCPSTTTYRAGIRCPVCDERTQFHSLTEWCMRCGWAENRRPLPVQDSEVQDGAET